MNENSKKSAVSFSVGELAFALALGHSEEAAIDIVRQQFGVSDEEEVELVIAASGHSLLARGLLEKEQDDYRLAPPLEEAARLLAQAGRSILCNLILGDESSFLAFHLGSGGLLKHTVRDERVHELEVLADLDEAVGAAADFYSAPERVLKNLSPTRLSPARVDETFFSQDPAFISARLLQSNVPEATAAALTDAIVNQRFWGAIATVDHEPGSAPVAEHRVSLLRGATDLWMLRPRKVGGEWFIELSPGSRQTLGELFSGILSE